MFIDLLEMMERIKKLLLGDWTPLIFSVILSIAVGITIMSLMHNRISEKPRYKEVFSPKHGMIITKREEVE